MIQRKRPLSLSLSEVEKRARVAQPGVPSPTLERERRAERRASAIKAFDSRPALAATRNAGNWPHHQGRAHRRAAGRERSARAGLRDLSEPTLSARSARLAHWARRQRIASPPSAAEPDEAHVWMMNHNARESDRCGGSGGGADGARSGEGQSGIRSSPPWFCDFRYRKEPEKRLRI